MDREKIITAAELMDMQFLPRSTVVDGMLPAGCYILAGAPKVGKSFLMAQLCWCVATGTPFLGQPTHRSQVLYLSLEDTGERVQGRLIRMFGVEHPVGRLHLKFETDLRGRDLLAMLEGFFMDHPSVRLVVIDTFQRVREGGGAQYSYQSDYEEIRPFKEFTDIHDVALILVHHTRKNTESENSFDRISGTNGLLGAADGAFLLYREKGRVILDQTGRDLPGQRMILDFDSQRCLWTVVSREAEIAEPPEPQPSAPPDEASSATPAQDTVSLQEVLESTVQSVLDEGETGESVELLPPKRRGLFSRRRLRDTERLYSDESGEEPPQEEPDEPEDFFTEDFGERDDTPEPDAGELAADYRDDARMGLRSAQAALLVTALSWLALLLDHFGVMPALFAEERLLSCLPFFIAELLVCVLGRDVFVYAFEQLRARTVTYELLSSLACAVTLADTALDFFLPARAALAVPFHAVAMLGMSCALLGRALLFGAMYDTFRVAAVGEPDYLVTVTAGGAAKRRGSAQGFSRCAQREDAASHWQGVLLPVLLAASLVFAVLSTLRRGERLLFLWNWGVLLTAINMLAFPLCYSLPLRRLTKRFVKSGSALAGYVGADRLRRSNCVILTDTDLFPPGTVSLNGLKIYGEESGKVISYAATMAHASQSGLSRLFDTLLEGEGGRLEPLDDLSFYEEGGVSGLIHGETVLFGTAAFCRKMHVTMPGGLSLKTGAFLAVDGTLIAIFAVKYTAAENVDWALHALKRSRITPVLAVRDGSITPALLKRKFGTDARAVYPTISTRLALSEKDGEHPYALLYREGLMPYAEIAVGSKRLVHAVRVAAVLSLGSSAVSALLAFYLTFVGAYSALTPVSMLLYLLLWALAALIEGFWADRY